MKKKALVLTVGTGTREDTNIVSPLVKTIENSNPNYTIFICTKESEENAQKIVHELRLKADEEFKIFKLRTEDDLQKCFTDIAEAFRYLAKKGFEGGKIDIDFTSGTKAMTGALVLAGLAYDCGNIKYITGERQNGVVIAGTERITVFAPNKLKAFEQINFAKQLIRELRFDTARDLIEGINEEILDKFNKEKRKSLYHIAVAYGYWDRFKHREMRGEIEKAKTEHFGDLRSFLPSEETKKMLVKIGNDIEKETPTWEIMADIHCNAKRRYDEGKYDDALARIYRLTEMLAQLILRETYDINPSDVDLAKVPKEIHSLLSANKNADGKIQIGLMKDYDILDALQDPLGQQFKGNNPFQKLLKKRNRTILAHGFFPVNKKECEDAFSHFDKLATLKNVEFEKLCKKLTFPWRKA